MIRGYHDQRAGWGTTCHIIDFLSLRFSILCRYWNFRYRQKYRQF
jgi:hypothetical protein